MSPMELSTDSATMMKGLVGGSKLMMRSSSVVMIPAAAAADADVNAVCSLRQASNKRERN